MDRASSRSRAPRSEAPRSEARIETQIRWLRISIAATLIAGAATGIGGSAAIATPDIGWGVAGYLWLSAGICLAGMYDLIRDLRHLRHIRQLTKGIDHLEIAPRREQDLTRDQHRR